MLCEFYDFLKAPASVLQGPIVGRETGERLSIRRDKNHVLFGGTKILQHTPDKVSS